jgi:hypothetical protein
MILVYLQRVFSLGVCALLVCDRMRCLGEMGAGEEAVMR